MPPNGVYIHGLFLQGAHWDQNDSKDESTINNNSDSKTKFGGCLTDAIPRVLFESMPPMWLEPYDHECIQDETKKDAYLCPIYKTTTRAGQLSTTGHSTNFIMALDLSFGSSYEASHWVRRGVALIAQLDT